MMTNTKRVAIESTHADVERMLHQLSWQFSGNGLAVEDCRSVAGVGFMRAYRTWTPGKSSFVTWSYHCVLRSLQDLRRSEAKHNTRFATNFLDSDHDDEGEGVDRDPPAREPSAMESILADLSEDARTVVRLLMDSPREIAGVCWRTDPNPLQARRSMWKRLKAAGWSVGRFMMSCEEIRKVLQ
jgi:DNA-directed RNA polymerase specialized sigma24 family protein